MNQNQTFSLPYRLDWDATFTGKYRNSKPGRGNAGWTVVEFSSRKEREAFMLTYPEARMPCWDRIEKGEV
jgi:hypothetical protein